MVDGGQRIIVTDQGNFRVQVFDENFAFVRKFGALRPDAGVMEMIESVSVGPLPLQEVYVADEKKSRIHRFSAEGVHR
jgi:hypothetical protein